MTAELTSQRVISEEIEKIHADARSGDVQPRLDFPPYRSTLLRHPTKELRHADPEGAELVAPVFGQSDVGVLESDLTIQRDGEPIGERILVRGRLVDGEGRAVRRQLVEIWQANAAGRYVHKVHQHQARTVPVAEPSQRVAPGAHPLLAVRHRLHPAPDHPDVLPG